MKYILDASAIIAFFKGENGSLVVEKVLRSGTCCIHSANWIELYYTIARHHDNDAAETVIETLRKLRVTVTDISDEGFRRRVATIKVLFPALSLGDCYAIGLTEWLQGTVVTSDQRFSDAKHLAKVRQIR